MTANRHLAIFETERRRLTGLAYRMTGSVADSEDMVQQAWIRWSRQDLAHIEAPSQWLGAVVTRLCLDDLKSARSRRETYVGAWLHDPLVQDEGADAERDWIVSEDISIALVLTLKNLSPEMRAAFILRDGFDYSFDEIAEIVGREPPTCRQLVSRARRKLAGAEIPTGPALADAQPIVAAFWKAMQLGVQPVLRSANQTPALVLWPPLFRPQARSRAVRLQAGRVDHGRFLFGAFGGKAPIIRAKPRMSPHCFQRLQRVFGGPYSRGASHQRKSLRLTKIISPGTHLSSTRSLLWLFGKNGFNRPIWFGGKTVHWTVSDPPHAVSQKSLLINIPVSPGAWVTQAKPHQAD